jgi:dTDP-4-amino-4,6-dideoxy-D-galactose acyltransferase
MVVERLDWDSDFFNFNVGKVACSDDESFDAEAFLNSNRSFKLVYVFSKTKIDHGLLKLVDDKVVLGRSLDTNQSNKNVDDIIIKPFEARIHSSNEIKKLALESGEFSRFNIDVNFKSNEYERLYTEWIEQSINKKIAFEVLVAANKNETILGFITLNKKSDTLADIGLLAVSAASRGKGIAGKLLQHSFEIVERLGFKSIQVVTQFNNQPAMRLYQNAGFEIKERTFVYHYWNL